MLRVPIRQLIFLGGALVRKSWVKTEVKFCWTCNQGKTFSGKIYKKDYRSKFFILLV